MLFLTSFSGLKWLVMCFWRHMIYIVLKRYTCNNGVTGDHMVNLPLDVFSSQAQSKHVNGKKKYRKYVLVAF
jgi:hypothetical protein